METRDPIAGSTLKILKTLQLASKKIFNATAVIVEMRTARLFNQMKNFTLIEEMSAMEKEIEFFFELLRKKDRNAILLVDSLRSGYEPLKADKLKLSQDWDKLNNQIEMFKKDKQMDLLLQQLEKRELASEFVNGRLDLLSKKPEELEHGFKKIQKQGTEIFEKMKRVYEEISKAAFAATGAKLDVAPGKSI